MNKEIKIIGNERYKNKLSGTKGNAITFFTPTYNRARFLARIEICLLKQTNKDFVWIIVNDGSKDDTYDVATGILSKNELPILFISKPNGGKHSAFKAALAQCQTRYFQCMDDDDVYLPNAVEFFLTKWTEIKASSNEEIGAIRTLAKHPDGSYSANFEIVEGEEYIASTIETNYVMKRRQENWTCYDSEKLRSIDLFPTYWMSDQHKFVAESTWQTRFARMYKCLYVNRAFREYRSDDSVSLSRGVKSRQHYLDLFLNEKIILDEQMDLILQYSKASLIIRVLIINFLRDYLDISYRELIKNTDKTLAKNLYRLTWIPSLLGKRIIKLAIKIM